MKRAIIIGNSGGTKNFLEGVEQDIQNTVSFLKSKNGGAWEEDEILIYKDKASLSQLQTTFQLLKSFGCEYFFILFTGHGNCDQYGNTYFELKPDGEDLPVSQLEQWVKNTPTLLIADSCHSVYHRPQILIESQRRMFSGGRLLSRKDYQEVYNNHLRLLNKNTFIFASSCSFGQSAEDTSNGGLYLHTMFQFLQYLIENEETPQSIGIGYIQDQVRARVFRITNGKQTPEITGIKRGELQPPVILI